MEVFAYVQAPLTAFLFWRLARRNVVGDLIAGSIVGMFVEFASEPLWNYHFKLTIWKDVSPGIIMGYGVLFALAVFFSEKLYKWWFKESTIKDYDKRIFITDVLAAAWIALPLEKIGLITKVWDYNQDVLKWSTIYIPIVDLQLEVFVGYALLMLIAPTFVRYWQKGFERDL
ncbi:MAG TPA: hypothetical protein VJC18_05155 [bacterium]|nr:hypothetical protein [bacterium]